jgi:hypothetical protein
MTVAHVNQRRTMRRALRVPCQVVRERDFRLVGERTLDVSTDGMLVASDVPVLTGEAVIVTFCEPRTGQWFDAEATVARVTHGRRAGEHGRCIGLRFERVDAVARADLAVALRGVPPPLPPSVAGTARGGTPG